MLLTYVTVAPGASGIPVPPPNNETIHIPAPPAGFNGWEITVSLTFGPSGGDPGGIGVDLEEVGFGVLDSATVPDEGGTANLYYQLFGGPHSVYIEVSDLGCGAAIPVPTGNVTICPANFS